MNCLGSILNLTKPLANRPQARFAVTFDDFDVVRNLHRELVRHRVQVETVHPDHRSAVVTCESILIAPRIKEQLERADTSATVLMTLRASSQEDQSSEPLPVDYRLR